MVDSTMAVEIDAGGGERGTDLGEFPSFFGSRCQRKMQATTARRLHRTLRRFGDWKIRRGDHRIQPKAGAYFCDIAVAGRSVVG